MTPRQSARVHLPDLDASFDAIKATFAASLAHLKTPDGEWGKPPAYLAWPMVRGDEFAPQSPVTPKGRR